MVYHHRGSSQLLMIRGIIHWTSLSQLALSVPFARAQPLQWTRIIKSWFTIIVTPIYSHRVYSLQAFEKPSQRPGYDDGKPGDDGGKSYTSFRCCRRGGVLLKAFSSSERKCWSL